MPNFWQPEIIIQVLIIAVFVYLALRFLQGTRGAGVLRGLVVLWILLFVTASFFTKRQGLTELEWLAQNVLTWGFLAVLIIFQPELRRGLVRLGRNPFLVLSRRSHVVDQISKALVSLSQKRIGALVAIERDTRLGSIVEGGTAIDAEVSAELIHTIFWPGTPLHDGGMIIHADRVVAAGCIFPLSEDPSIQQHMGTRHRAAVGLSEESDAIVLVVSEETGNISICLEGKIIENLSQRELVRQLVAALPKEGASRSKQ